MKYLLLVLSLLFFSACSPKYKIVKEYHPPQLTDSSNTSVCLGLCETKRSACKQKCESTFNSCKVKAHRIALQRYNKKMQDYTKQLENYVDAVDDNGFESRFIFMNYGYGYPYYYYPRPYGYANSLFWYDPMPYYGSYRSRPKPKKPSLEQENLKAEAEFCDLDCGCTHTFDTCYTGCGGTIVSKKLCIENCP